MTSSPSTLPPPPATSTQQTDPHRLRKRRALACLIAVAGCVTIADLLLKRGALSAHADAGGGLLQALGIAALASPFTLVGIFFHLLGLAAWLYTLRAIPLVLAYSFTAVQQATVALGAWLYLGEQITPLRWAGIAAVLAGVVVLVPTIITVEQRAEAAVMRRRGALEEAP